MSEDEERRRAIDRLESECRALEAKRDALQNRALYSRTPINANEIAEVDKQLRQRVANLEKMQAEQDRAASIGWEAAVGYKNRQDTKDKQEIRGYARAHWQKFPTDSIAALLRSPAIAPFLRYWNKRTVGNWIKDLKPGGTKPGRPKKQR